MILETKTREITGKKARFLRKEGLVPAVIFAKNEKSQNISVNKKEFLDVYKEAGDTSLIELKMDNNETKVLVRGHQIDPVTGDTIHIDFYKVNLKEKTTALVPLKFDGEPEIVKSGDAIVLEILNEVEVECLPTDIPREIVVDINKLEDMDTVITIGDLDYDKEKVEITGHVDTDAVVKLDYAEMEEEEEEEISEEEAIEGIEATEEKDDDDNDEKKDEPDNKKESD